MMWTPQTIMPVSWRSKRFDNTHLSAYGLGWRINDMDGYLQVHHSGSLAGMYSFVSLFPELDLGFVVLTNQQSSAARSALMYTAMKPYLGDTSSDWLAKFSPPPKKHSATKPSGTTDNADNSRPDNTIASINNTDFNAYIGTYDDPWLGHFIIEQTPQSSTDNKAAGLQIRSLRVEKLVGTLYLQNSKDNLLIRWHDRSLEADAIIHLKRDNQGIVIGMTLAPESKDIDFSYDFQDLDFTKLTSPKTPAS
jgi:hypothetical protein